jgi:hypothetical protein
MRRLFGLLIGLVFLFSLTAGLTAQQTATQTTQQHNASAKKLFRGKIEAVTMGDPTKGTTSEITVLDPQKKSMIFLVKSTTTLYNATGTAITLDKIVKGSKVRVRYTTTPEAAHEAASVRVMK